MKNANKSKWLEINSKFKTRLNNAKLKDLIKDSTPKERAENFMKAYLPLYLAQNWPFLSKEESENILDEFWGNLIKAFSKLGISEINQIKLILSEKRNQLNKDLEIIPRKIDFEVDWYGKLIIIKQLLDKKIDTVDRFLTLYSVRGEIKKSGDFGKNIFLENPLIENIIENVATAISKNSSAIYSFKTIKLYLQNYIELKSNNFSLEKIRDRTIEECNNQVVEQELTKAARGTLDNWGTRMDEKIQDVKEISQLLEQKI